MALREVVKVFRGVKFSKTNKWHFRRGGAGVHIGRSGRVKTVKGDVKRGGLGW